MLYGHNLFSYLKYSAGAACIYMVSALIFICNAQFTQSWELYIGNFLFGVTIAFFIYSRRIIKKEPSATYTAFAALLTSIMGALIACVACLIAMIAITPSAFAPEIIPAAQLHGAPAQMHAKNNGFVQSLVLNAVLGNMSFGFFFSMLFPFVITPNE